METRRSARIPTKIEIDFKISDESKEKFSVTDGESFKVKAVDVSTLGMGIVSPYFVPKGVIAELVIEGAEFGLNEPISVKAEVRYCNYIKSSTYRCGMKFIKVPLTYKKAITEFYLKNERRREPRIKLSD